MRREALVIAALAACGGSKSGPSGPGARDAAIDAWKKGGLDVSAFAPAMTNAGKDCAAGTVAKLDVLVCNYGSADEATNSADLALQWVGDTSGKAQAAGTLVIAVADRHKADPHGKTTNQIYKLASN